MKSVRSTLTIIGLTHALLGAASELSSKCENDQLILEIPYTVSSASSLLGFTAGICNVNHITTGEVRFDHDVSSELATVTVDINACNLAAELYDVPISTRSLYKATAYVSIGVRDDVAGVEYIYYSATIATECGAQTKYQIDFSYGEIKSEVPDNVNPDTCQQDAAGNCIIPAYEAYNFNFDEYTSETYSTKTDATTKQQTAGSVIYLQVSSSDITSTKKFAIEQCTVKTDSGDSLTIFDGATSCTNDFIGLSVVYTENSIQIFHRLFQFGTNAQSSYTLSCDIEVCDKSAGSSNCNALATSCMTSRTGDATSFETYICDGHCSAGQPCYIDNGTPSCGRPPIDEADVMYPKTYELVPVTNGMQAWIGQPHLYENLPAGIIDNECTLIRSEMHNSNQLFHVTLSSDTDKSFKIWLVNESNNAARHGDLHATLLDAANPDTPWTEVDVRNHVAIITYAPVTNRHESWLEYHTQTFTDRRDFSFRVIGDWVGGVIYCEV